MFNEIEKHCAVLCSGKSICFITESTSFGGTEIHTLSLMKALIERGHRITLIACRHHEYDDRILAAGLNGKIRIVHSTFKMNDFGIRAFYGWKKLLNEAGGDVVVLPKGWNRLGNLTLHVLCRRKFKQVFIIEHIEPEPAYELSSRWWCRAVPPLTRVAKRIAKKLRASNADCIIAVSHTVRDRLIQDWGYRSDKIVVVQNGVSWRGFRRDEYRGEAFRARHRISSDEFVFGMITRLTTDKGIDIALRALRLVLQKAGGRKVRLVIAGNGGDLEQLTLLSKELGVQESVVFVGFVREVINALSAYDVILFPSRKEGLPLGLLEGMAAGCVPIVSRIAGMPEAVDSPALGWVVKPESVEELCSAMRSAMALEPIKLSRMRAATVDQIRRNFDLEGCHGKIFKICGL